MSSENQQTKPISFQLLSCNSFFDDEPELEKYRKLIVLALQSNNDLIQWMVYNTIKRETDTLKQTPSLSRDATRVIFDSMLDILAVLSFTYDINSILPFPVPHDFDVSEALKKLKNKQARGRYHTPDEFNLRVKLLLENSINYCEILPKELIYHIYILFHEYTGASDRKESTKRSNEASKLLYLIESELKKAFALINLQKT